MEGAEFFGEVLKYLGGAGVATGIMYLWIKSLLKENDVLKADLKDSQEARVVELKNVLPLLTEASKGLQEFVFDNKERDTTFIKTIIDHINTTAKELGSKCKP